MGIKSHCFLRMGSINSTSIKNMWKCSSIFFNLQISGVLGFKCLSPTCSEHLLTKIQEVYVVHLWWKCMDVSGSVGFVAFLVLLQVGGHPLVTDTLQSYELPPPPPRVIVTREEMTVKPGWCQEWREHEPETSSTPGLRCFSWRGSPSKDSHTSLSPASPLLLALGLAHAPWVQLEALVMVVMELFTHLPQCLLAGIYISHSMEIPEAGLGPRASTALKEPGVYSDSWTSAHHLNSAWVSPDTSPLF